MHYLLIYDVVPDYVERRAAFLFIRMGSLSAASVLLATALRNHRYRSLSIRAACPFWSRIFLPAF